LNWFASGGIQLVMLILVVAAVGLGIAATVRRERAAARLASPVAEPGTAPRLRLVEPTLAPPAKPALAVLEFDDEPGVVTVEARRVSIGRHSDDTIRVKDVTVSRHHAVIELKDNGRFEIVNQTAARSDPNPVMVNGIYREQAELNDGDLVTLGGVTFRFRDKTRSAAA
jgi:hypothetical protein